MKTNTRSARKRRAEKRAKYIIPLTVTEKVERALELPHGVLSKAAHIELTGNRRAVVDGSCGIVEYGEDIIKLDTGSGVVRITGSNLMMSCLTDDSAVVEGHILSIEFI